jgi:ABC-2 type transport system ATP-binding protein
MTMVNDGALLIEDLRLRLRDSFELRIDHLEIASNHRLAIVGHNGAGKSMLLECIVGLTRPDSGNVIVGGRPVDAYNRNPKLRKTMGVQLQRNNFPENASVRALVHLHRAAYGQQDADLAEGLDIRAIAGLTYGRLSKGEKQRIDMYMALAHRPPLAILDEPTAGLDATRAGRLAEILARPFVPAFCMASHREEEIAAATHLLCLRQGSVVAYGERDHVVAQSIGQYVLELDFADQAAFGSVSTEVRRVPSVRLVHAEGLQLRIYSDRPLDAEQAQLRGQAESFRMGRSTLDDFLSVITRGDV